MTGFDEPYRAATEVHDGELSQARQAAAAMAEAGSWIRGELALRRRLTEAVVRIWKQRLGRRGRQRRHGLIGEPPRLRASPADPRLRRLEREIAAYRKGLDRLARVASHSWPGRVRHLEIAWLRFRLWFTWGWRLVFAGLAALLLARVFQAPLFQRWADFLVFEVLGL